MESEAALTSNADARVYKATVYFFQRFAHQKQ
jgi:hypothetical protein